MKINTIMKNVRQHEQLRQWFNGHLEGLARVELSRHERSCSAFKVCGYAGLALAILLTALLASRTSLSLLMLAGMIAAAALTFLSLAMATKLITGREQLTYYHHQLAFLFSVALLLRLAGQPVLPFLDIGILGVGLLMACGRTGCLMVGCCHGRPSRWGIVYRVQHADAGFTPSYVGVRLFPVQAVEACWVLCVVSIGALLVVIGSAAGTALGWYLVAYAAGRFCFEFLRGDAERPYFAGFSEAQWTSLLVICATLGAALSGLIVFHLWYAGAAIVLALAMLALAVRRRPRGLSPADDVREVRGSLAS